MPSTHEFALTQAATALMSANPQWAHLSARVCARLNDIFYDQRHVDVIMQSPRGMFDLYDAFAFLQVHTLICDGTFLVVDVPVGCEPSRDKSINRNRAILAGLDRRFTAEFRGGFGDSDGFLRWHADLDVINPEADPVRAVRPVRIARSQVPLEVGYTRPSRTLMHLIQEAGVARWPYGRDQIRLILRADLVQNASE